MISIIVPIYNTERYLPQCLDSILTQTYNNLEVICVNDGSPGNCMEILENYRKRDPRIVIVDQQNKGLESARQSGFLVSKGDFIMHVDSDDWLEGCDTLNVMRKVLIETKSDYVEVGHQRVMDRHAWIKRKGWGYVYGIIEQPSLFDEYYISYFGYNKLNVNVWGKLYRRDVIELANPKLLGVTMGEDLAYNIQIFPFLKRICILDRIGYNYRFGGMTCHYNSHLLSDIKKEFLLKEYLIEQFHYEKASRYACIEMKNVLKTDICQQIIFNTGDKKYILDKLTEELNDPLWDKVADKKNWPSCSDPFVKALIAKDVSSLHEICKIKVEKEKMSRIFKRIVSYICMKI